MSRKKIRKIEITGELVNGYLKVTISHIPDPDYYFSSPFAVWHFAKLLEIYSEKQIQGIRKIAKQHNLVKTIAMLDGFLSLSNQTRSNLLDFLKTECFSLISDDDLEEFERDFYTLTTLVNPNSEYYLHAWFQVRNIERDKGYRV